jgi:hypothetical protein
MQLHDSGVAAGYVFCCSGVFVYQYIKYHEVRKATKGHPGSGLSNDIEAGKGGQPHVALARSKAEIMSEMRKLQDELTDVDKSPKHSQ